MPNLDAALSDLGEWLKALDARVTALEAAPDPELEVDEEPQPEPEPEPTQPTRVAAMWHHCFSGPLPWLGYPEAARKNVNRIILALAQSAGKGTGKLGYYNRFGSQLAPAIKAARDAGVQVVMGIGGSSDGGITITNATQVNEAFDSIAGFVTTYGINGIDIDLEPSGSAWTEAALVAVVARLKAAYGPGFVVGITPGLYGEHAARWMSLAKALGSNYDYMAPMLYDFPEAGDSRLTAVALDKCRVMLAGGVPEAKMMLGFMTRPAGQSYPNATPGPQLTIDAWRACLARYPQIQGAFHWEDLIDQGNKWAWSLTAAPVIKNS